MKTKHTLLAALMLVTAHLWAAPFTDNGDGTVTDSRTNLRWQKCSMGQTYNAGACDSSATSINWKSALTYCQGLGLASRAWRLPSKNELVSIVDDSKFGPAIDTTVFPGTVSNFYWSSSTYASSVYDAWNVNFTNGDSDSSNKTTFSYVRCVSSGP